MADSLPKTYPTMNGHNVIDLEVDDATVGTIPLDGLQESENNDNAGRDMQLGVRVLFAM